jgi:hypothetical protein
VSRLVGSEMSIRDRLNGSLEQSILLKMLSPAEQISKHDAHPNLQGHRLIANNIHDWIIERRIV